MPKKAFDRLSVTARGDLFEKAMRLYVELPFEQVTLQRILSALSLHPATFYRYFEDKNELYETVLYHIFQKRREFLQGREAPGFNQFYFEDGAEPLSELELQFTKTVLALPEDVLLTIYRKSFFRETYDGVKEELRRMRYGGKLRPDVDDDLIATIFSTVQFNLILFFREFGITDEDLMIKHQKYLREFFRHGLMDDAQFALSERD